MLSYYYSPLIKGIIRGTRKQRKKHFTFIILGESVLTPFVMSYYKFSPTFRVTTVDENFLIQGTDILPLGFSWWKSLTTPPPNLLCCVGNVSR